MTEFPEEPVPTSDEGRCFAPRSLDEMTQILFAARAQSTPIDILGAGTRVARGLAGASSGSRLGLSTLAWEGVDVFEPDEGVIQLHSGTTVAAAQEIVEREGWELPLDPSSRESTVGGVIASASAGPRAQAFGRVADAVLGLEVLGADGEVRQCGGRVVKNVTGYDLAKLYCGSFGTLGILTRAWLRLRPAPASRCALRAAVPADASLIEGARAWRDLPTLRVLTLAADANHDADADPDSLYVELGGGAEAVAADRRRIENEIPCQEVSVEVLDHALSSRGSRPAASSLALEPESVSFRASVLGSELAAIADSLRDRGFALSIDLGLATIHASGRFESFADFVELRRRVASARGFLTVLSMPETWRGAVEAQAIPAPVRLFMEKLRNEFDPEGLLNRDLFEKWV